MSKRRLRKLTGFAAALCLGSGQLLAQISSSSDIRTQRDRAWTVTDSVQTRYFVTRVDHPNLWLRRPGAPVIFPSPDGKRFLTVVHWGDTARDREIYELKVYNVQNIISAITRDDVASITPRVVRIEGSSRQFRLPLPSPVYQFRWIGNEDIAFIRHTDGADEVRRLNVRTGVEKGIEGAGLGGQVLSMDSRAGVVSATFFKANPRSLFQLSHPFMFAHDWSTFSQLKHGGRDEGGVIQVASSLSTGQSIVHTSFSAQLPGAWDVRPSLSPDGRYLAVYLPAFTPTESGEGFRVNSDFQAEGYWGLDAASLVTTEQSLRRLWRLSLIDLDNGIIRTLIDAPRGPLFSNIEGSDRIFWSADSRRLVLVNSSLPLQDLRGERGRIGFLVDYDISTDRWTVLQSMGRNEESASGIRIDWLHEGRELAVGLEQGGRTIYSLGANGWSSRQVQGEAGHGVPQTSAQPRLAGGLDVTLSESANEPPRLLASFHGVTRTLDEPNAHLRTIWRARSEPFVWRERGGHLEQGGLMLPRHGVAPFPLVVQLSSDYLPNQFLPEGDSSAGMAAQDLVAHGIAVLQLDATMGDDYPALRRLNRTLPAQDAAAVQSRVEAAVSELARQEIVDPDRVGLIGFSRTGYYVNYFISHPKNLVPLAGIVNDSVDYNYGSLISNYALAGGALAGLYNDQYKTPFWQSPPAWLEHSPSFNAHRVETAALFSYHVNDPTVAYETYGSLKANRREIEIAFYPDGGHSLTRPRQRAASLQLTVDWMAFWLLGIEIGRANRSEQYVYWRRLRAQRDERWNREGDPRARSTN